MLPRTHRSLPLGALSILFLTDPALAQRTGDNAVTAAEDAFGTSIGNEQLGLYGPNQVRGFSPVDAGNVRIEGLYFDQQAGLTDRLIEGSTVRVGLTAQGYPFPAPTGIADYRLRKAGDKAITSIVATGGPYETMSLEVDAKLPIDGERFGIAGGFGIYREETHYGSTPDYENFAIIPTWRPAPGVDITAFFGQLNFSDEEPETLVFTSGDHVPPRVPRLDYTGQPWAEAKGHNRNYGLIAKAPIAGFDVQASLVRSDRKVDMGFADLLFGVDEEGNAADRVIIADADNRYRSTSGEVRVSRSLAENDRRHTIHLMARGRDQKRRYGGADVISLGPTRYTVKDYRPKPDFVFGPDTRDEVQQTTFGAGYELRWRNVGELGIGIQKTDYRKRIDDPAGPLPESRDKPWLYSVTAAAYLTPTIALYGGYVRGLEESPVAPDNAVNRNEAPPAIRTRQADAGVRIAITPALKAVAGVFEVVKPYYNVDTAQRFRQLGDVRHRGVELSLAGEIVKGLNVVAGTVFLDARISGEEVDAGLIRNRPTGAIERNSLLSVDWRPRGLDRWSFDAVFESVGDRIASAAPGSDLVVPPRTALALGTRYRFPIGKSPAVLRAQLGNILNTFGYGVGDSGFFVYNLPRRFTLSLTADL
ncbi:iron complex outermembrane recepter protein [Sphingomonas laterariae]|uniref:Iron complex outermembrane recepter protein n=2 Tax=Edaphosphingomonas laterariae TaxID=861865 RepID=A0A239CGB1_9SPHN|nr:iron complex outermembrane recepter protein [Sphingomonas laterariae]